MAELKQPSARQQATTFVIIGLVVLLIVGVAALFLSPSSPLRPQASEIPSNQAAINTPVQDVFRDGTVSKISGSKVTVDEPTDSSFTFTMKDDLIIRSLNADHAFEITDRSKLTVGDTVSVFYDQSAAAQRVARVDIILEK